MCVGANEILAHANAKWRRSCVLCMVHNSRGVLNQRRIYVRMSVCFGSRSMLCACPCTCLCSYMHRLTCVSVDIHTADIVRLAPSCFEALRMVALSCQCKNRSFLLRVHSIWSLYSVGVYDVCVWNGNETKCGSICVSVCVYMLLRQRCALALCVCCATHGTSVQSAHKVMNTQMQLTEYQLYRI